MLNLIVNKCEDPLQQILFLCFILKVIKYSETYLNRTLSKRKTWFYCMLFIIIDIEECIRSKNGYEYMGSKSTTEQGKTCATRSDGTSTCRGETNSPKPWCYTVEEDTRWDTCDIPQCSKFLKCRRFIL